MTVADYIIGFLYEQGIRHVFTVSGGGSIFLCDALAKSQAAGKMRYICCHHEQACGYAAEAYARLKGLGVCLVTSGPGGTNAVSAVASAWLDHIPVLFLSGQAFLNQTITDHPGLRQLGVQEINIVDIIKSITKFSTMLTIPELAVFQVKAAIEEMNRERPGPAWIDIPGNIQNARI